MCCFSRTLSPLDTPLHPLTYRLSQTHPLCTVILLLVAACLLLGAAYLLLSGGDEVDTSEDSWDKAASAFESPSAASSTAAVAAEVPPEARVRLYFGSQTGTAEGFCDELKKEATAHGFAAECIDLEELDGDDLVALAKAGGVAESLPAVAVFLVATYGEGEPTDNAASFYRWMKDAQDESTTLDGLYISVFGLGNRQYEHFNSMGRETTKFLVGMGARVAHAYGEGDDDPRPDGSMEDDFEAWHSAGGVTSGGLWRNLREALGLEVAALSEGGAAAAPGAKSALDFSGMLLSADGGRWARGGGVDGEALAAWKAPKTPRKVTTVSRHFFNAFPARIVARRELCAEGADRSVVHLELGLNGVCSPLKGAQSKAALYETAANVGVVAENDAAQVEEFAMHFQFDEILDRRGVLKPSPSSGGDAKVMLGCCIGIPALTQCTHTSFFHYYVYVLGFSSQCAQASLPFAMPSR